MTIDEIKTRNNAQHDDVAHRLVVALSARSFGFGSDTIKPIWSVSHTGRVQSAKPNIQGKKSAERLAGLKAQLKPGQALVHCDIKSAEPSVIKYLLKYPLDRDLYRQYTNAAGCTRDEAKKRINAIAYVKNSLRCFPHWPDTAQAALRDYVEMLHTYKIQLFEEARKTRSVTTLAGRAIAAEPRERLHPGKTLSWRVQGTVADILNGACLSLLDVASVVVPLHDAAYVILPKEQVGLVEDRILDQGRQLGLALKSKTEVFTG